MVRGCGPRGIGCGGERGREDESTGGSQSTTKILMIKKKC